MTTDMPRTAVGKARGMSSRVSSHFLPLKSLRTIIQAIGRPMTTSITVTMSAMVNEFHTAPSMTAMVSGSSRTSWTRSHSVKSLVTTKTAGMTMTTTKAAMAKYSHARRTLVLLERSSRRLRRDTRPPRRTPEVSAFRRLLWGPSPDSSSAPAVLAVILTRAQPNMEI